MNGLIAFGQGVVLFTVGFTWAVFGIGFLIRVWDMMF